MNALLLALVLLADGGRNDRINHVACIELNNFYAGGAWLGMWQVLYWDFDEQGRPYIVHFRCIGSEAAFTGRYDPCRLVAVDEYADSFGGQRVRVEADSLLITRSRGDPERDDLQQWGLRHRRRLLPVR